MDLFFKFGYQFKNPELVQTALTHKSYFNENLPQSVAHNEKLEFLGDAVLDLSLSSFLMKRFPDLDEGELSKIRASLVNEATLSEIAKELGVDQLLRLGKGEIHSGGASKPRLLASAFEASLGALFNDSDFVTADGIICKIFESRVNETDLSVYYRADYKTRLQEKMQEKIKRIPQYALEKEEGPDHEKTFFISIKLDGQIIGRGVGRNKKQAEQDAARQALESLPELTLDK